jgi:hypothetical protein
LALDFYIKGAVLPTPLDFFYWIGKSKEFFKKISKENSDNKILYSEPYSRNGKIWDIVDDKSLENRIQPPYSHKRRIEIIE